MTPKPTPPTGPLTPAEAATLRAERHQARASLAGTAARLRQVSAERTQLRAERDQARDERDRLRAERDKLSESVSWRTADMDEVRDALTNAGHGRAQVTDWPDVMPALRDLIAERDYLRSDGVEQDRDRARRIAVALEQELANAEAMWQDWRRDCRHEAERRRNAERILEDGPQAVESSTGGIVVQAWSVVALNALRALNAPSDAATRPHSAPHTPSGPEDHTSPERPTRGRTDDRTDTEG